MDEIPASADLTQEMPDELAAQLDVYATMIPDELPPGLPKLLKQAVERLNGERDVKHEVEAYPGELRELRARVDNFDKVEVKIGKGVVKTMELLEGGRVSNNSDASISSRAEVRRYFEDGEVDKWLSGLQAKAKVPFKRFGCRG